jgi:hypothetical protein
VLKSQFNSAWNYFSAHELGETVLGYWQAWFDQADINHFDNNNGYYRYGPDIRGLDLVDPDLCSEVQTEEGHMMMPDIQWRAKRTHQVKILGSFPLVHLGMRREVTFYHIEYTEREIQYLTYACDRGEVKANLVRFVDEGRKRRDFLKNDNTKINAQITRFSNGSPRIIIFAVYFLNALQ